ncbi:MAG: DegQ family serine endoprotease [Chlorobiaceae bacterium]|nr:DegQ family serine endoprotease [Chlorobiaceae bacterium]
MSKKQQKIAPALLVSAGLVAGAVALPNLDLKLSGGPQPAIVGSQNSAMATEAPGRQPIQSLSDLNQAFVSISDSVMPSVVTIYTETLVDRPSMFPAEFFGRQFGDFFNMPKPPAGGSKQVRHGLGSGVIVSADGYILTNNHVIDGADTISITTSDNRRIPARVIGKDPRTDIAVIRVDAAGLKPIAIGNSDRLRVGEWVLAVGSPIRENLARTVTHGIVSAKGRANVGLADYEDFIQTDAAINPGNSGGPLVNINGELVGINTAIASRTGGFEGIGFAVPSNMASKVLNELVKKGKVTRGYLGITIQDIDENLAKGLQLNPREGVLVGTVMDRGPAAKAGIRTGDVILEFNGRKVASSVELRNAIAIQSPGTTASLVVNRDGAVQTINARLEEQPDRPDGAPEQTTRAESGTIGFTASVLDAKTAQQLHLKADSRRMVVTSVQDASPAFLAGLRPGDVILSVDKKSITSLAGFSDVIKGKKRGDLMTLLVERGWNRIYFAYKL